MKQAACHHVPLSFEYLHGWRFYGLFGQPAPVSDHPQDKEFFTLCLNGIFCIPFVPIASHPVTGCQWEKSGSIFSTSSRQVFSVRMKCYSGFEHSGEAKIFVPKLVQLLIIRYHPTHTSCLVLCKIRLAFLRFRNYVCIYELYSIMPTL